MKLFPATISRTLHALECAKGVGPRCTPLRARTISDCASRAAIADATGFAGALCKAETRILPVLPSDLDAVRHTFPAPTCFKCKHVS